MVRVLSMPYCTYVSCSPCTHQHRTILILCRDAAPTRNKPSGWIRLSSQICSGLLGNCPKAPCRKASGAGARTRAWSQALYPVHSTAWVTPPVGERAEPRHQATGLFLVSSYNRAHLPYQGPSWSPLSHLP